MSNKLIFQDVVEGSLDANPIDRQYVLKLSKLNKKSFVEARWIFEKVWTKSQRQDAQNFLFSRYKERRNVCIKKGWLLSLTSFIKDSRNIELGVTELFKQDLRRDNDILRYVICSGHVEILQWLVETFNLTVEDVRSRRILNYAIETKVLEMIKYLVETFNLTVEDVRSNDNWILLTAAARGHLDVLRYLVETFKLTVNDVRSRDNEALRMAASNGHLNVLRYLVETFNLNIQDVRSRDNEALQCCHSNVLRYLIEKFNLKAGDINLMDKLKNAAAGGELEILMWLVERNTGRY